MTGPKMIIRYAGFFIIDPIRGVRFIRVPPYMGEMEQKMKWKQNEGLDAQEIII